VSSQQPTFLISPIRKWTGIFVVSKKSKQSIFAVLAQGAGKADALWKKTIYLGIP